MHLRTVLRSCHIAAALIIVLAVTAAADKPTQVPVTKLPDPPGTAPIMNRLRDWFRQSDVNLDQSLDKEELAKAFGYKQPYDRQAKEDARDTDAVAEQKRRARRADYQFLTTVDKNGDGKVSYEEFLRWARGYAVQVKKVNDLGTKIAKDQLQLQGLMRAGQARRLAADLTKQQQALASASRQLPPFDAKLRHSVERAARKARKRAEAEKSP